MTRVRDYQAEYQRRKALGSARGLSTAQARGHARRSEQSVSALKTVGTVASTEPTTLQKYYAVAGKVNQGQSLSHAAKEAGTTPGTVRRLNRDRQLLGKTYRVAAEPGKESTVAQWTVGAWPMHLYTREGCYLPQVPLDRMNASIVGRYWNAVDKATSGDASDLPGFATVTIYDIHGHAHHLLTNINAIYRLEETMTETERRDFSRLFYTGREVIRRAS